MPYNHDPEPDPLPVPPSLAPEEPALFVGTVTAIVAAVIGVIVSFGINISDEQEAAILGVVAILAPLAATLWVRGKVWSPASVRKIVNQQRQKAVDDARAAGGTL